MPAPSLSPVVRYIHHLAGSDAASAPSDSVLLERFVQHGDAAAFELLLRRHGPLVLGVCRRLLRDEHDIEDAFQVTFLVLLRKARGLRQPEQLGPWLYGVACRTARKARALADRRRRCERALEDPHALPQTTPAPPELWAVLDEEVQRLPRRYREPVVLCYLQGLTQAEAARQLGCAPGTVATRLARARARLRDRLARQGVCLPGGALADLAQGSTSPTTTLLGATLRTATSLASTGTIPPSLTPLTEGVCHAMTLQKWKTVFVLLALGLASAGLCGYRATAGCSPAPVVVPPPAVPAPATSEPEEEEAASVRTANFHVKAPSRRVARLVAEAAEQHRKAQALKWLGKELTGWEKPCSLEVKLSASGTGGATSFAFDKGRVLSRDMRLEGALDRILANALPHEVTHTILADHFGQPVPRWADEGASILAEDEDEQQRHDKLTRQILDAPGRAIPLKRLLPLSGYPRDVMALYAEGYSVTRFLVERKDRKTFLAFVAQGQKDGWDKAVKEHYALRDVGELEAVWLAHLKRKRPDEAMDEAASDKLALPKGPAPLVASFRVEKGERLVVVRPGWGYKVKTSYVRAGEKEEARPVTTYEQVLVPLESSCDLARVRAYGVDGKEIDPRTLAARLRKEKVVLVSADGRKVDPYHLQLTQKDALILVLPEPPAPPPAPPALPPVPAAPPTTD